jgi:hypothetical protein
MQMTLYSKSLSGDRWPRFSFPTMEQLRQRPESKKKKQKESTKEKDVVVNPALKSVQPLRLKETTDDFNDDLNQVDIQQENWDYIQQHPITSIYPIAHELSHSPGITPLEHTTASAPSAPSAPGYEYLTETYDSQTTYPSVPPVELEYVDTPAVKTGILLPSAPLADLLLPESEHQFTENDFVSAKEDVMEALYQNPLTATYEQTVEEFRQYSLGGG